MDGEKSLWQNLRASKKVILESVVCAQLLD